MPDLQDEILAARNMVKAQITEGKRGNDAWAMADLAMAIMLSNDAKASKEDVPIYYERYAAKADIDDIQTTLRILMRVLEKLRQMGDPVASLVEQGLAPAQPPLGMLSNRVRFNAAFGGGPLGQEALEHAARHPGPLADLDLELLAFRGVPAGVLAERAEHVAAIPI